MDKMAHRIYLGYDNECIFKKHLKNEGVLLYFPSFFLFLQF